MATEEIVTGSDAKPGDRIGWTDIRPDGTEAERTGLIWGHAPPVSGMKAYWVAVAEGVVLVCRCSRRHQAGRALASGRYGSKAGRFVDKGEWFRETDPRSRFAVQPPNVRRHAPAGRHTASTFVEMDTFRNVCVRAERGETFDFSVRASDVAVANDAAERERSE